MVKAIFFDMDGTLTSLRDHKMPDSARAALYAARRRGVKLFLATGRHPLVFQPNSVVDEFPFDAYLTANGQFCYSNHHTIYRKVICGEDKAALVALLKEWPVPLMFFTENKIFGNVTDERVRSSCALLKMPEIGLGDPAECLELNLFTLLIFGGPDDDKRLLRSMPRCRSTRWHDDFADIIPADGGKGRGIEEMLAHYQLSKDETMAFGDADNDLDMFDSVGLSVAMGNARENVKARADYITADVERDGVYAALRHFEII